jgi:hypothetical protein
LWCNVWSNIHVKHFRITHCVRVFEEIWKFEINFVPTSQNFWLLIIKGCFRTKERKDNYVLKPVNLLWVRSILFWDITQLIVGVTYRRFGTIYRSHLFGFLTLKMGKIGCPEMSVRNYHYTLRNIPEERRSHVLRSGSLKSSIILGCLQGINTPRKFLILKQILINHFFTEWDWL